MANEEKKNEIVINMTFGKQLFFLVLFLIAAFWFAIERGALQDVLILFLGLSTWTLARAILRLFGVGT